MSDFVAEVKARSLITRQPSCQPKEDFVAEIRCKSHSHTDRAHAGSHCYSLDESDLYLQKILSDRQFSRGDITRLLEGSVITLIETLLVGQTISNIEGSLSISLSNDESPIVVRLFKPFSKSPNQGCQTQQSFDSCLNVKIKDRDISSLCPPYEKHESSCSPCYDFSRDPCHSPTGSDSSILMSLGYHSDRDTSLSSPPHDSHNSRRQHDSSISSPTHESSVTRSLLDAKFLPSSPIPEVDVPEEEKPLPSENEEANKSPSNFEVGSDYICNEKTESDIPNDVSKNTLQRDLLNKQKSQQFNDYFCDGFDGKNTLHLPAVGSSNTLSQNTPESLNTLSQKTPESSNMLSQNKPKPDSCSTSDRDMEEMMDDYDDGDVELERLLVIDETPTDDLTSSQSGQINGNKVEEDSHDNHIDREKISAESCFSRERSQFSPVKDEVHEILTDELEEVKSVVYPNLIDIDAHVDLLGNNEVTSDVTSLILHPQSLVSKHPEGFKCKQCCNILPDATAVSMHVKTAHDLHCCNYCCRTFTAKNNLKRHVRRHTGQRPYKCLQCPQSFFRRDDLKGHMIRHDYTKPFRCSVCKKGYTDRACVKNHMSKEHRSRVTHVCPPCGESFDGEEAFATHKRSHLELKQFSCSTCSFIGTNRLMTLKHSLLHGHKLFSCKPCNAYFADPFHYTNHVKKHKKNISFTQYICCFCDVTHATYDQYIRHEYSHAQGKVHTCKICKKQFRSKPLLRDHAVTHRRTVADKCQAEQRQSDHMNINRSHSSSLKSRVDKENSFLSSRTYLCPGSDEDLQRRPDYNGTKTTLPTTLEESQDDGSCGQLLDLSMKKASSSIFNKDVSSEGQSKSDNYINSMRAAGQSVHHVLRNGTVSAKAISLSQEVKEQRSPSGQSSEVERRDVSLSEPIFILDDHQITSNPALYRRSNISQNYNILKPEFASQSRSAETANIISVGAHASCDRKVLSRAMLNSTRDRPSVRLSPYNREKIADLAAKFMVARGTKLSGQRKPLKAIIPFGNDRTAIIIKEQDNSKKELPSWELTSNLQAIRSVRSPMEETGRNNLVSEAFKDNGKVMSDNTNLGTTLRCHIPTVVKSESPLNRIEMAESPLDCRFQKAQTDDINAEVRTKSGGSHSCEVCREMFGSFIELENHSVDAHKRYLCEHCRKSFTARPNRDRHVRYHTGERPYRCDLCDLAFFRGDDLKYHRTTRHPTAQPFVCTNCSASFTWGRDLERHIRHSKCKV